MRLNTYAHMIRNFPAIGALFAGQARGQEQITFYITNLDEQEESSSNVNWTVVAYLTCECGHR